MIFKKGGFDSYDMETSLMRIAEEKLHNLVGIDVKQGEFLQVSFDECKNKLTIQIPKKHNFAEFCALCGSVGVIHFEEEGDIKMHRCLRCLDQWDDCSISKQDTPRGRLLNG